MDKKNTMLLTVIAVATLLVAVVGATFAYFSLTTNGNGSTTVGGKVGKVPSITIKDNTPSLTLTVSTAEMLKQQGDADVLYYAVTSGDKLNATSAQKHEILNLTIADGDADTKYDCAGNVKVTVETTTETQFNALQEGDAVLVLYGLTDGLNTSSKEIDLYSLISSKTTTETIEFGQITGNATKSIYADLYIKNKKDEPNQNYMAGLNITVKLDSTLDCPVHTAA